MLPNRVITSHIIIRASCECIVTSNLMLNKKSECTITDEVVVQELGDRLDKAMILP